MLIVLTQVILELEGPVHCMAEVQA